jgi:hypothetical protein
MVKSKKALKLFAKYKKVQIDLAKHFRLQNRLYKTHVAWGSQQIQALPKAKKLEKTIRKLGQSSTKLRNQVHKLGFAFKGSYEAHFDKLRPMKLIPFKE